MGYSKTFFIPEAKGLKWVLVKQIVRTNGWNRHRNLVVHAMYSANCLIFNYASSRLKGFAKFESFDGIQKAENG